jgi:hypothetical protein
MQLLFKLAVVICNSMTPWFWFERYLDHYGVSSPIEISMRSSHVLVGKHNELGLNSGLITIFRSILPINVTCNKLDQPVVILGNNCLSSRRTVDTMMR